MSDKTNFPVASSVIVNPDLCLEHSRFSMNIDILSKLLPQRLAQCKFDQPFFSRVNFELENCIIILNNLFDENIGAESRDME